MRRCVIFLASAGYVGYIPVASGTFGSLVGFPLFWGFDRVRASSVLGYVLTYVLLVGAACWLAGQAEQYLHEHDSHKIVIDEVVGYLAATMFLTPTWSHTLWAFVLFRALDIVKPFPAGYIDKHLPGGYGVVLDDVVSGLYTNLALQLVIAVGLVT
ncbi:MAG: phosphatidylglycerophosphatase A [Candidatus Binatia bacterium]